MSSTTTIGRLLSATANYGVGGVLPKIVSFLMIPVFTAYLSPDDYGLLEMAGVLGSALSIAMRFGLPGAVARYYYEYPEGPSLRDYVTTVSRFLLATSGFVGASFLLATSTSPPTWLGLSTVTELGLVVFAAVVSGQTDIQRRLLQARENAAYAARLSTILGILLTITSFVFVVITGWGAVGVLFSQAVVSSVSFVVAMHYMRIDLSGVFRWNLLKGSARYAAGVFPSHIIGVVSPFVQRAILLASGSLSSVGEFSLATRFVLPLTILSSAFNNAYLPIYFSIRKTQGEAARFELATTGAQIWKFAVVGTLAVSLCAPPVIVLLTPISYHPATALVPVLTLGFLAQIAYLLLGPELFYSKNTWAVPVVSLVNASVSMAIVFAFARTHGPMALAVGVALGSIASALVAAAFSRRTIKVPHDFRQWLASALFCGAAYGLHAIASPTLHSCGLFLGFEKRGIAGVELASAFVILGLVAYVVLVRGGTVEALRKSRGLSK